MNEINKRTLQVKPAVDVTPRFFTVPRFDDRVRELLSPTKEHLKRKRKATMTRYAGYVRISSEEQVGNYSVEAQRRAIQTWVQAQSGQLVQVYVDEAQSGRNANRPAFLQMRQDARKAKFDAL